MTVEVKRLKQAVKGTGRENSKIKRSRNKKGPASKQKLKNSKKLKKNSRSKENPALNNKEDVSSLKRKTPASESQDATPSTAGGASAKVSQKSSKKRVSFSSSLVQESPAKENDEEETEVTPKKSILKRRSSVLDSSTENALESPAKKQKKISLTDAAQNDRKMFLPANKKLIKLKQAATKSPTALLLLKKREMKLKLQEMKIKKRPDYVIVIEAKKLWEELRKKKTTKERKRELSDQIYEAVKGKVLKLINQHDSVRVIQCLMALKSEEMRTKLFEEVKTEIVEMAKSKYSRFFVVKMLKYGTPEQRQQVMDAFKGKIPLLLKHSLASSVIEFAYNTFANALQRTQMACEFYGPELALFKPSKPMGLVDILSTQDPAKRTIIMDSLKDHLMQLATKPVFGHTFVHRLYWDYFENAVSIEQKHEIIDTIKERLIELFHTRDGARVAMQCIWFGGAKDRKTVVKTLRPLILKAATEEYAHWTLISIFDTVDDTVMVGKNVVQELMKNVEQLANDKYGRKVLLYLLKPRDPHNFTPDFIRILQQGDSNPLSKKPQQQRWDELNVVASSYLIEYLAKNAQKMLFDQHGSILALSILLNTQGDKALAYKAMAEILSEPFEPGNVENYHAVEHSNAHFVLKMTLKNDRKLAEEHKFTLTEAICESLSENQLRDFTQCNKGCFLLISMIECGLDVGKQKIQQACLPALKTLNSYSFAGAKILVEKLK